MRVVDGEFAAVTSISYLRARSGGGRESTAVTVGRIQVDHLPEGCEAVLATGDLQGITTSPRGGDPALLGIVLAEYAETWSEQGILPPLERVGAILTGDLYSAPQADTRGATGDVTDVWLAFAVAGFSSIVGVRGNHDLVSAEDITGTLLDGTSTQQGRTRFAGVGGIIGDPQRRGRRDETTFLGVLDRALESEPDVLIMHEGPSGVEPNQPGNPTIRQRLKERTPSLTLCGHAHWNRPVSQLGDGHVINVDNRVAILVTTDRQQSEALPSPKSIQIRSRPPHPSKSRSLSTDYARGRGHRQLPRPVACGAVLPDEEDRPGRPAHVPPHPRRDRSALELSCSPPWR